MKVGKSQSIMNIKTCCYKCEDRELGCHSSCEKYKEYIEWFGERKASIKSYKQCYIPHVLKKKK